jgi:HEPN domain-containing protein
MKNSMNQDVKYWGDLSKYDIDTAKAMLESGRYLYVLFTCQQSVEKLLKALVVQNTKKFPPKIHDLVKLSNIADIDVESDQKEFLAKLNYYYLETRYPNELSEISKQIKKDTALTFLKNTKKLLKWLKSKVQ